MLLACVRPEHLAPGLAVPIGMTEVVDTVFQGGHRRVLAVPDAAKEMPLLARLPLGVEPQVGGRIALAMDPGHVTWITVDGEA